MTTTNDDAGTVTNTVALGTWTNRTFSAGNFSGSAAMTWTVGSGSVTEDRYELLSPTTLVYQFYIAANTTIGGTVNPTLQITIPNGYTANGNQVVGFVLLADSGGGQVAGYAQINNGSSTLLISKATNANFTLGSTCGAWGTVIVAINPAS